jgi:tripartite-type tricarboxylate transporter receptor subunit TctC
VGIGIAARRAARVVLLLSAAALYTGPSFAQSAADKYPERPIKIIVPFAPGGSTDILARVIAQKMLENWGQQVVVETRPGAATVIGTGAAAQAAPDGYTLVIVVSNHATNPSLNDKMPYDALKDFEFISLLGKAPMVPYVNPKFPPQNLKELVAYGKTNAVPFGSAGLASMTHLLAERFKADNDVKLMQHVVYKGGTPALNDVLGGQIPMTFGTVTHALPQYQGKLVRALGVSSDKRHHALPDVPTFREQGFDIVVTEWYGLLAPAGTPKPIVAKLNAEMRRILALPLGERVAAIDLEPSTPEELRDFIKKEIDVWGPMIKQLGIKPQ